MNAIIYRRFSSDEQEKGSSDTLARQQERCEALALARGWKVAETITDRGMSAFKGEHLRPEAGLGQFLERLRRGEFAPGTVLVADNLSRLSRRPVDEAMAWIYEVTRAGVQIAIADTQEVFQANPSMGDFLATSIKAAFSHEDSRRKSDMTRASKARLWKLAERKEGRWTNLAGRLPAWLERTPRGDGWIVNEERARIVFRIYRQSADGIGVVTITRMLNDDGIEPFGEDGRHIAGKRQWGRSHVRQLLVSAIVEGDFRPRTGMFAGQVIHGFYPRIVDADIVAQARAALTARKKVRGEGTRAGTRNLFSGMTKCGECGRNASLSTSVQKGKAYPYIRCEGASEGRCDNRNGYAYRAFEVTALDLLLDLALDDRFFESRGELGRARTRKAEIEKTLADRRAFKLNLLRSFTTPDPEVAVVIQEATADIDRMTTELDDVEQAIQIASGKVADVEHFQRIGDIREAANSEVEAVRLQARAKLGRALRAIVETVEIRRDPEGEKVFELVLVGNLMMLRISTKGQVKVQFDQLFGQPLWAALPSDTQEALAPLIQRIQARAGRSPTS